MTKAKISEYDPSASNNTDVNGVNIAEGCAPSGINDAIREVMAALKRFETGSDGDSVTVGGNLVVSGSTTVSNTFTASLINVDNLRLDGNTISSTDTSGNVVIAPNSIGQIIVNAGAVGTPIIAPTGDTNTGIFFPAADTIAFAEGGAEAMRIDSDGDVGIGTSNPTFKLEVSGSIGVSGNPAYLLKAITYRTTGTAATYTTPTGVRALYVECVGGGGGGGGVDGQGVGTGGGGGGGSGGGYVAKLITTPSASYTFTIGAGGAGGAAGNNGGADGSNTTFTDGTLTLTANGGGGGQGQVAAATLTFAASSAAGSGSGGDIVISGYLGGSRNRGDFTAMTAGSGGGSVLGNAPRGASTTTSVTGTAATEYGAGGSGGAALDTTTDRAGGNGYQGVIRITEYL